MGNKPWRCRYGIHEFVAAWNPDNQRYRRCRRCGKDDAGIPIPQETALDLGGLARDLPAAGRRPPMGNWSPTWGVSTAPSLIDRRPRRLLQGDGGRLKPRLDPRPAGAFSW